MAGVAQLPLELFHCALDYVSLTDVLRSTKVCKRWRQIAFSHPKFWRNISVTSHSSHALDFFLSRLRYSSTGRVHVRVKLITVEPAASNAIDTSILPALTQNMYRIASLHIELSVAHDSLVYRHLTRRPAPSLNRFGLIFIASTTRSIAEPLPENIFAATCPGLLELSLGCCDHNTLAKLPPVLSSARLLSLSYADQASRFPFDVFSIFKGVSRLSIQGNCLFIPPAFPSMISFSCLEYLNLQCGPDVCDAILFCRAVRNIPQLTISGTSAFRCPRIIDHLSGDLALICSRTGFEVTTSFRSINSGLVRTLSTSITHFHAAHSPTPGIVQFCSDYSYSPRDSVLSTTTVSNRIVELELFADSWGIFSDAFVLMPSCTKLTFIFNEHASNLLRYAAPAPVLPCHALATLVLKALCEPITLRLTDVVRLLRSVLPPSDTRALVLESIELVGEWALMQGIANINFNSDGIVALEQV